MKRLIVMATVSMGVAILLFAQGCSSLSYGQFKANGIGSTVKVGSASWVKTYPDGTSEAFTIDGGNKSTDESVHTLGNVSMAALGALVGGSISGGMGAPAGAGIGAASGVSLSEAWQTAKDWLAKNKTDQTSVQTPPITPSVPVPAVLNDDPNCALIVKYQGREPGNDGQLTYLNHVLTSRPFANAQPVCVQYNDFEKGEVTVWKDQASRGQRVDTLPSDRGINKIVVWYE